MAGIVVQNIERADPDIVAGLGECGVATVHEAQGAQGASGRQHAADLFAACGLQLPPSPSRLPPATNWMVHVAIEQVKAGDILVFGADQPLRGRAISAICLPPRCRRGAASV